MEQLNIKFQSPCGEEVMKVFLKKMNVQQKIQRMFQSPCGEEVMKAYFSKGK